MPQTDTPNKGRHSVQVDDSQMIGQVLDGRYRIDEIIGRGAMGVVYRGEHVAIRRPVAVKVLHASLAGVPELRGRFEREALAIGRIDHPHCVGVFDFGALPDGALYLVMEYLQGESLGDLLHHEHLLEPRRALHILRGVLRGLEHVHSQGVVHRDLKPENILLVNQDGDPDFAKILDFGIAKLLESGADEGVTLTQAGMAFGTPLYMAPEQALGNPLDGRADLYGLSVIGFELLTGAPPFYSDDKITLLSMHTSRPLPAMSEIAPEGVRIPRAIEELIRKGLAKRPSERFADAAAYGTAIDDALLASSADEMLGEVVSSSGPATLPQTLDQPTESTEPTVAAEPDPGEGDPVPNLLARWPRWIAAAAVLALAIAAVQHLRARGDEAQRVDPGQAATAAAGALDRGNPTAALKLLEESPGQTASDPQAQLQRGHAYAALRDPRAVSAYGAALTLLPELERDPALRANLAAMANDKDPATSAAAFELLITRTQVSEARARLAAATVDPIAEKRAALLALVERLELSEPIDWLTVYALDLEQGKSCEERRPAIAKLRALGDPRAVELLEKAIERKGKTAPWKGKAVNQCLFDDARAALDFLRRVPPATSNSLP
jgi:serine/threonine protein kinase